MLYVKLTKEQTNKVPSKSKGYTSSYFVNGKRVKENITFCSNLDFLKHIGVEEEKTLIEI
jgi:hypothetical protein